MSGIDVETKRKLCEMGAAPLMEAIEAQDESFVLGPGSSHRLRLVVDETHSSFTHATFEMLTWRPDCATPVPVCTGST